LIGHFFCLAEIFAKLSLLIANIATYMTNVVTTHNKGGADDAIAKTKELGYMG